MPYTSEPNPRELAQIIEHNNRIQFAIEANDAESLLLLLQQSSKLKRILYKDKHSPQDAPKKLTLAQYAAEIGSWDCVLVFTQLFIAGIKDNGKYTEILPLAVEKNVYPVAEALIMAGADTTGIRNGKTCEELAQINLNVKMLLLLHHKKNIAHFTTFYSPLNDKVWPAERVANIATIEEMKTVFASPVASPTTSPEPIHRPLKKKMTVFHFFPSSTVPKEGNVAPELSSIPCVSAWPKPDCEDVPPLLPMLKELSI